MIIELFGDATGILHGTDGIKIKTNPEISGTLVVDSDRIHVDGLTVPNFTVTGNKPCVFIADDGMVYNCELVNIENGKIKPVHRTSEQVISMKRTIEKMEKQIAQLTESVNKIDSRMNYKGLDFLKGQNK